MRALVDTHALLWYFAGDRRLGRAARTFIDAEEAEPIISAASVWELAVKTSSGKLALDSSVEDFVAARVAGGYRTLSVSAVHAAAVESLPWHHRDPFDRLLVAQAEVERLAVVTRDPIFRKYGVSTIW